MVRSRAIALVALIVLANAGCDADPLADLIAEFNACLAVEPRVADSRVSSAYDRLMGRLNDKGKADLRESQRAWLKDRNETCGLSSGIHDRDNGLTLIQADPRKTACVTNTNCARAADLKAQMAGKRLVLRPVTPSPALPTFQPVPFKPE